MQKKLLSVISAATMLISMLGCGNSSASYRGTMTVSPAKGVKDPVGVVGVSFTLLGKPAITKTRGHAHTPIFGSSGKNTYKYDNDLTFDQRRAHLTSSFHPISLYKTDTSYFLLGQSWFDPEKFQWYALKTDSFEEVKIDGVPGPILSVHPVDLCTSSRFRLWVVTEFLVHAGEETAAKYFSDYVNENPHFPYEQNIKNNPYTTFPNLLERIYKKKADGFYAPLVLVMNSALYGDHPQDVVFVGVTIKMLREEEGLAAVQDFVRRVKAEGRQDDSRIDGLERSIKEWTLHRPSELQPPVPAQQLTPPKTDPKSSPGK